MANELIISADLYFNDGTFDVTELVSNNSYFSPATLRYTRIKMSVAITETVIPLGNISTLGYAIFCNRDATNTIYIKTAAGGSRIITLPPTDFNGKALPQMFYFGPDVTAPVAIALVAACNMEYLIVNT